MAHLPPEILSSIDPFSQQQTLFLPAPGKEGVLLIKAGESYQSRRKKFVSVEAALAWCQKTRTGLVLFYPNSSENN